MVLRIVASSVNSRWLAKPADSPRRDGGGQPIGIVLAREHAVHCEALAVLHRAGRSIGLRFRPRDQPTHDGIGRADRLHDLIANEQVRFREIGPQVVEGSSFRWERAQMRDKVPAI